MGQFDVCVMRIVAGLEFWTDRKLALICRDIDKAETNSARDGPITSVVVDEPKDTKGYITICDPFQNVFSWDGKFLGGLTPEDNLLSLGWDRRNHRFNRILINVIGMVSQFLLNNENTRFHIKFFDNSYMPSNILYNHNKIESTVLSRRLSKNKVNIFDDQKARSLSI